MYVCIIGCAYVASCSLESDLPIQVLLLLATLSIATLIIRARARPRHTCVQASREECT